MIARHVNGMKMRMKTNEELITEGMDALFDKLGMVDAERFISLILKENFDYTKWQTKLFENETIDSLGNKAFEYAKSNE